tara:strand:- start:1494 stop:2738 length:1245 start_codon:yes stop_codon:yes gene_type:complete
MSMDIPVLTERKNRELKKHVAIIHSSNKISLLQRKISNALLFNAYDDLLTKDEHEIHVTTLTKLIGYDSNDHKRIKQALMDLLATVIEWNIVDGDKIDSDGIWNASSIIADASIEGSTCTYSYSNKMRKLLYHPTVYGRLCLEVQAKFQSGYGLALYENCNRYQEIGQTPWFELEKFRKLMGVDDNKYKIFRDFKTRVLDKSVEEVNKHSLLVVEPRLKKINRKVVAIQFSINKSNKKLNETKKELEESTISELLKNNYGLSQKQIAEIVKNYEEAYIIEKIELIESSNSYKKGMIKNLGKYLLCALEENYQQQKSAPKDLPKSKEKDISGYEKYLREEILKTFNDANKKAQEDLLMKFENYIKNTAFNSLYNNEKLKNVLVQDQFIKFIMNHDNEIKKSMLPLNKWLNKHETS